MEIYSLDDLNELHIDILQEIGNIGSGNAATALATMLNKLVDIEIPTIKLLHYNDVAGVLGGGDSRAMSMTVGLEEDLNGIMLQIVSQEFASNLVNTFYPKEINSLDDIDEMDLSVMQEMSNITTAAYINAIATMTDSFINITPPSVGVYTIDDILEGAQANIGHAGDKVLYIDQNLVIEHTQIKSSMIMILTMQSLNKLMEMLQSLTT